MSSQPVIRLHNSKETEFEFDVAIQGPSDESSPVVRFVLENVKGYNVALDCKSVGKNKWAVRVPAIGQLDENHNFHVEVIVDGYFFVPTSGLVEVTTPPQVAIKENFSSNVTAKPQVQASFEAAVVRPAKKRLVEFKTMSAEDQNYLHQQTVKAGEILIKAGSIMENGFNPLNGKAINSAALGKLINMVKESLDSINNKIFLK